MKEMNKINAEALGNVNGGTHEELVDLANALGMNPDIADVQRDEMEEALFYKHRIEAWLYCYDCQPNFYRDFNTEKVLTHAQVIARIS